jgi:hypothetical protein
MAVTGSTIFHSADELGSEIAVSCDMCHGSVQPAPSVRVATTSERALLTTRERNSVSQPNIGASKCVTR